MELDLKEWFVWFWEGKEAKPVLISDEKVKQNYPELLFRHKDKEFKVEFYNKSDFAAARDSGIYVEVIVSPKSSPRIKARIAHKRTGQTELTIKEALEKLDLVHWYFIHRGKQLSKEQTKLLLEWADFMDIPTTKGIEKTDIDDLIKL